MGCKILNLVTWPWPRPFEGRLALRRLALDIAYTRTKFDDLTLASAVPEIFKGV